MNTKPAFLLAFAVLSGACSSPSGMTVQQYAAARHPSNVPAKKLSVQMTYVDPKGSRIDFPKKPLVDGKPVRFSSQREFKYVSSYSPASISADRKTVHPPTPQEFNTTLTGFEANLQGQRHGQIVTIEGDVAVKDFQGFSQMQTPMTQPIRDDHGRLIVENRIEMPNFSASKVPFAIDLRPNDAVTFRMNQQGKNATVMLRLVADE